MSEFHIRPVDDGVEVSYSSAHVQVKYTIPWDRLHGVVSNGRLYVAAVDEAEDVLGEHYMLGIQQLAESSDGPYQVHFLWYVDEDGNEGAHKEVEVRLKQVTSIPWADKLIQEVVR